MRSAANTSTLLTSDVCRSSQIWRATCALSSMASCVCVCLCVSLWRHFMLGSLAITITKKKGISMQIFLSHYLLSPFYAFSSTFFLFCHVLKCFSSSNLCLFTVWCFMLVPSCFPFLCSFFSLPSRCCFSGLLHVLPVIVPDRCHIVNQSHTSA